MPRASSKKPRAKTPRPRAEEPLPPAALAAPAATAVAEPPGGELQPPTTPIETSEAEKAETSPVPGKDHIAASLNIAKLQAMSMTDLNTMAR